MMELCRLSRRPPRIKKSKIRNSEHSAVLPSSDTNRDCQTCYYNKDSVTNRCQPSLRPNTWGSQPRGRLKIFRFRQMLTTAVVILSAYLALAAQAQSIEDLKNPIEAYDFDFGRRVSIRDSRLTKSAPEHPSTLEALKSSRVRKRNFSVQLPSERTLDIRDAKKENQLEQDRGKDESHLVGDDETRSPLHPAPPFTTSRTTLQTKRIFSPNPKSSDWIPLTTPHFEPPVVHAQTEHSPVLTTRRLHNNTKHVDNIGPNLPASTVRTIVAHRRNSTLQHHPTEPSVLKNESFLQQAVAESNLSVLTSKPDEDILKQDTSESPIPFGSRTNTSKTTIRLVAHNSSSSTQPTSSQEPEQTSVSPTSKIETDIIKDPTTVGTLPFGARTTTVKSVLADQSESSSVVRPVLKRPPIHAEATTRSKPITTEPSHEVLTSSATSIPDTSTPPQTTTKVTTSPTTTKASTAPPTTTKLTTSAPVTTTETTSTSSTSATSQESTSVHNSNNSRVRVRLRDSLVTQFQGAPSAYPVAPKNFNAPRSFARNLEELNNPEDTERFKNLAESAPAASKEVTGPELLPEKPPSSSPLIAPTPDNLALNSDKRSSLVRTRTTVSKLLTTTRSPVEVSSYSNIDATTESLIVEILQEDLYTDKRLAELALSEPAYPSTEKDSTTETETFSSEQKDQTESQGLISDDIDSNKESSTPVVERPAGLQKELLAAIRRKITQTRSNSTSIAPPTTSTTTTTSTTPTTPAPTTTSSSIVVKNLGSNISFESSNDVSPDSNLISSTQHPSFFKPIPFPGSVDSNRSIVGKDSGSGEASKVHFFVRLPNSKSGSQVKIPDISHIQGKLARLNAAINEGLQEQRRQQHNSLNSTNELEDYQDIQSSGEAEVPVTAPILAISPTTDASETESQMVLTSTSVSSIFSVVTGSSHIKSVSTTGTTTASTTTTTPITTTTTISTTTISQLTSPLSSAPSTVRPERISASVTPRLNLKEKPLEVTTEFNAEATSRASSVSEIITIGKTELRNVESSTIKPLEPIIAQKTYTYLDRLREKQLVPSTPVTTPPSTTTTTLSSKAKPTTKKPEIVYEIEPKPRDHPSSHFRPEPDQKKDARSKVVNGEIVTPSVGEYNRGGAVQGKVSLSSDNETETLGSKDEAAIQDITGTTVYVVGVICVIPAAGLVAWVVRYIVRKKDLSNSESGSETGLNCPAATPSDEEAIPGTVRPTNNNGPTQQPSLDQLIVETDDVDLSETSAIRDALSNSVWHILRKNLKFQTVLGEGNFGKVWKAEAENICGYEGIVLVAVKTTKENAPEKEKADLLQEMKIMQTIGHHPNVVSLIGVCTEKEPYLLVMEYVMYGKLLTHLREQRSRQVSLFQFTEADLQGETGDQARISSKDLTKYAYGVAKGMEFLVSKGIIHRDLAARNILVDHAGCCKISDFGLSRNLGDTGSEMYEQKTKGALPIRWMAPESLYFSVFTPKSDVWSFGILMWEIVTLGSTPYPGMGAREVMRRVRDGYRLERPSHCHPDLYKIISKCWAGDMNKRPDFTELRQELAKLLEDQHGYIDLYNIPENKYYSMTQSSNEEEKL